MAPRVLGTTPSTPTTSTVPQPDMAAYSCRTTPRLLQHNTHTIAAPHPGYCSNTLRLLQHHTHTIVAPHPYYCRTTQHQDRRARHELRTAGSKETSNDSRQQGADQQGGPAHAAPDKTSCRGATKLAHEASSASNCHIAARRLCDLQVSCDWRCHVMSRESWSFAGVIKGK